MCEDGVTMAGCPGMPNGAFKPGCLRQSLSVGFCVENQLVWLHRSTEFAEDVECQRDVARISCRFSHAVIT